LRKDGTVICELARDCKVPAGDGPNQCPHRKRHAPLEMGGSKRHNRFYCHECRGACCWREGLPETICR
jgi:hypothetical protein